MYAAARTPASIVVADDRVRPLQLDITDATEIAAAADLVKGKLTSVPVAVVRGLAVRDDGSTAHDLVRPGVEDLFWLGTDEALARGRLEAVLMRRSVRQVSGALRSRSVPRRTSRPPAPLTAYIARSALFSRVAPVRPSSG